ncbi:MAG: Dihydrofolate reductase [Candidatus Parcubacteria bacterium]|jgi:dihydrofolate reductase
MPTILIAALSRNRCIGKAGKLPWDLPEDLRRFRQLTKGHPVVMGRKTWESLPEMFRPLPGRTNIVLTRQEGYTLPDGVEQYAHIAEALAAHKTETVFVIGGGEVYTQALPFADTLELTHVDQEVVDGDAFFPEIDPAAWRETAREDHDGFSFVTYQRA